MRTLERTDELTVIEYQQMIEAGMIDEDERVELWEGTVRDMSPVGGIHSAVVGTVTRAFYRTFAERYLVRVQDPLELSDRS